MKGASAILSSLPGRRESRTRGGIRRQFTHVIDVLPTLLDVSQVPVLAAVNGIKQAPIEGSSFAKTLVQADAKLDRKPQYFEMLGNRAIWQDGWKAVAFHGRMPWDVHFSDSNFADDAWNLYRIDEDPSETQDLAGEFPDKLLALKALFHEEALKYNVYPLDDSTSSRVLKTFASFTAGKDTFTYTQADRQIHEALAPPVKNRSHTIIAKLSDRADGVIVAAGGRFGGYTLFVQDNHLFYTHNFVGEKHYEIVSAEAMPAGPVTVRFEFDKTGEHQGIGRLYIDDRLVGQAEIPKTTPILYSQYDTFDVGEDSGAPVSKRYDGPFAYQGSIESVEVRLKRD